jgi:hypothetical protein
VGSKPVARRTSSQPPNTGLWRAVLEALESNIKTARLVVILLTLAVIAVAARP